MLQLRVLNGYVVDDKHNTKIGDSDDNNAYHHHQKLFYKPKAIPTLALFLSFLQKLVLQSYYILFK